MLSSSWNTIRSTTATAVNAVKATVSSGWNGVKSTTSSTFFGVQSAVSGAMSNLRSTVSAGVANIKNSFNSLSSIASSAYSWGCDICSQMAAGVRAAADSVVRAAENVARRVRSRLHFSVPDTGPLSDADKYMPDFMKLLASGIKKNQGKVVKAVKTLSGSMKTNLNTPVGDMGDKVRSVVSGLLQRSLAAPTEYGLLQADWHPAFELGL